MAFIGIALNIWVDTFGTGGAGSGSGTPANAILDRFNVPIVDRAGSFIVSR